MAKRSLSPDHSPRIGRARIVAPENRALKFIPIISPADEMATGSERNYYHIGFAAVDCVRLALQAAEFHRRPRTVLDFPCGHGRVLRMLKAAYPFAELTACDLNRDGVEFCAKTFGARPVYSREQPEEIELPGSYELIWVGSLLTHLDAPRWTEFLRFFSDHLEPGGVLVFTTHGRGTVDELRARERSFGVADIDELIETCQREGFGYQDYVNAEGYGISLSRPAWVCAELERHPELELLTYTEGGWNGRQDAVACRRVV